MDAKDRKAHWENIYSTKTLLEVSWYQPTPETSIRLIEETYISKEAKIIDVGGGDSFLVDHLLELGYTNLTVLDISSAAIERAKKRLGNKAELVKWIISDITKFQANEIYDVWHDRAAFHFLTAANEIKDYTMVYFTLIPNLSKSVNLSLSSASPASLDPGQSRSQPQKAIVDSN